MCHELFSGKVFIYLSTFLSNRTLGGSYVSRWILLKNIRLLKKYYWTDFRENSIDNFSEMGLVYCISFCSSSTNPTINDKLKELFPKSRSFVSHSTTYNSAKGSVRFTDILKGNPGNFPYCFKAQAQIRRCIFLNSSFVWRKPSV